MRPLLSLAAREGRRIIPPNHFWTDGLAEAGASIGVAEAVAAGERLDRDVAAAAVYGPRAQPAALPRAVLGALATLGDAALAVADYVAEVRSGQVPAGGARPQGAPESLFAVRIRLATALAELELRIAEGDASYVNWASKAFERDERVLMGLSSGVVGSDGCGRVCEAGVNGPFGHLWPSDLADDAELRRLQDRPHEGGRAAEAAVRLLRVVDGHEWASRGAAFPAADVVVWHSDSPSDATMLLAEVKQFIEAVREAQRSGAAEMMPTVMLSGFTEAEEDLAPVLSDGAVLAPPLAVKGEARLTGRDVMRRLRGLELAHGAEWRQLSPNRASADVRKAWRAIGQARLQAAPDVVREPPSLVEPGLFADLTIDGDYEPQHVVHARMSA